MSLPRQRAVPSTDVLCEVCGGTKDLIGGEPMCCAEFVADGLEEARDTLIAKRPGSTPLPQQSYRGRTQSRA